MTGNRVVIIGGGFGGLSCAKGLRGSGARITLVDRTNHHLFQPLLYQVATAGLSAPEIAHPIRSIFRRRPDITVLLDEVMDVDLDARLVRMRHNQPVGYDYLVLATGARTSYFGNDAWAAHALGLKSLEDAVEIRQRVLLGFEEAENSDDAGERERLMTLVIAGGGPTGVELAGAFAELGSRVLRRDFRRIDPRAAKVILIEAGPRLLPTFPEKLSQNALDELRRRGVEVLLSTRVDDVQAGQVHIAGRVIPAHAIVWAAGVAAAGLSGCLDVPKDRAGHLLVEPDLALPGFPDVFAIGDIASIKQPDGTQVPGVSPAAMQMGVYVADVIRARLRGAARAERPFRYRDKGSLATIGRHAAVAWFGPLQFTGYLAWLLWLFVHILFLIGFRNKAAVLLQWAYAYIFYRRGARVVFGRDWMEDDAR
ncbi:MAG: NAD(P)/FAD-dependent oxidoreductase [Chthoniobacterales bacterium]|nr:NAD(P)/FAD-dependent oxidoreductase [Chthoniobacterales bacterium]